MWKAEDNTITAAFFMEGLHLAGYDECIRVWGDGCLEMVSELVSYVPYVTGLVNHWQSRGCDFPGVYDYAVSSPFGRWWGEYLLENGKAPQKLTCETWLAVETKHFFLQAKASS